MGPSKFTITGTLKGYKREDRLKEISSQPFSPAGVMMRLPRLQLNTIIILPVSEIVIFEDASHQHHLEKTDEYLKVVRNFIDKAEKRQMFTPLKTPIPLK